MRYRQGAQDWPRWFIGASVGRLLNRSRQQGQPSTAMTHPRIPADVADAFGEALVLLVQWQGGADEPVATLDGRSTPISKTFEMVASRAFRDEVPGSMLELLQTYAGRDPERQKEIAALALVPTYETAARCLLIWVGYKKSKWRGK
jgi:hypothetical protein